MDLSSSFNRSRYSQNFDELNKFLKDAMQSSIGLAEGLQDCGESYTGHVKEVEANLLELAGLYNEVDMLKESVLKVTQAQNKQTEYEDPDDLCEMFASELSEMRKTRGTNFNPKSLPVVVEFLQCLEDCSDSDSDNPTQGNNDDDIVVDKVQQSLYCPLTRKLFEKPVTSRVCHHSYSLAAITEHIKKRSSSKCPVCNTPLLEADLITDKKLEKKVKKEKQHSKILSKSKQHNIVKL